MKRNSEKIREAINKSLQSPFWIRKPEHMEYVKDYYNGLEDSVLIAEFIKEKSLRNPKAIYISGTSENQVCIEDMIKKKLDEL